MCHFIKSSSQIAERFLEFCIQNKISSVTVHQQEVVIIKTGEKSPNITKFIALNGVFQNPIEINLPEMTLRSQFSPHLRW